MLDEKHVKELENRVKNFIKDGTIEKSSGKQFVEFFLNNAENSLDTAKLLFKVSTEESAKKNLGFADFNGFLWVINSSYYSMFYMARALLEKNRIKFKRDFSIHSIAFDALVYYFYLTGKLQKKLIDDFEDAREEASEILGREKARQLIEDYFHEKKKRGKFTYEMGVIAMRNKAETSLKRAKRFNEEIRKLVELD